MPDLLHLRDHYDALYDAMLANEATHYLVDASKVATVADIYDLWWHLQQHARRAAEVEAAWPDVVADAAARIQQIYPPVMVGYTTALLNAAAQGKPLPDTF